MNYTTGSKNKGVKESRKGNKKFPILTSMGIFTVLFLAMSIYLFVFCTTKEEELINNSYNSRQEILLSRNTRGTIFSRDNLVLATTVTDEDGKETRIYPYGKVFSHIIGYDTKGKMGVEGYGNYYLINSNISISQKVKNDTAGLKNPGDNIYTTLDTRLQKACDSYLNVYQGAIVITEVKTGKILAMVSHPGFDPNEIDVIWDKLIQDENNSVLLNRVTQGLYPPGSTFKICTALEFYRQNKESYQNYRYLCNGNIQYNGARVECYHGTKHGLVDFRESFVKSCNSSFANYGLHLDWTAYEQTMKNLLFNQKLPTSLTTSNSSFTIPDMEDTSLVMQTSFGQGKTLMTPLHLNMITAAIANDGILMKPYVIDKVISADDKVIKEFPQTKYGPLMLKEEAFVLQDIMTAAVTEGTYTKLKNLPYTVAGKTGSAEFSSNKEECHSWFTGYAPAEDPEIALTLIMEGAGTGGDYAVPLARDIFDVYFDINSD